MLLPLDGGLRPAQRTQPVAATAPQDFEQRIDRARNDQRGSGRAGSGPIQQDKNVTEAIRLTRQAQEFNGAQNVPAAERGMELRAQARSLLTPGFVQAGLPVAHDERAMPSALNGHERQLTAAGRNTPGFNEVVADTKRNVSRDLNELIGPLRPPIVEAQRTGNWSGVQQAAERQLDTLTRGSSDLETAVNGLGRIMLAGGPRRGAVVIPSYQQAIEGAKHTILVDRPAQQIIDAAALNQQTVVPNAYTQPEYSLRIAPELTVAEQVTRDTPVHVVSPERAAQILSAPGVRSALSGVIADIPEGPHERGQNTILTLAALADRVNNTAQGRQVVDRIASDIVQLAESDGLSPGMRRDLGGSFRAASTSGRSPALAIRVADQLYQNGHYEEASELLEQTGAGVQQQVEDARELGQQVKTDLIYPQSVAAPAFREPERLSGLQALLDQQQPLLDRADRMGEWLVLTRNAIEEAPQDLFDALPGASNLLDARDSLKTMDQEGSDLYFTHRLSPSAAAEMGRMAEAGRRERITSMSDQELDWLLGQLHRLPTDDPAAGIIATLGRGEAARRTLRGDPHLTLALIQQVNSNADNGVDVPSRPTGSFLIRMGEDFYRSLQGTALARLPTPLTIFLSATGLVEFLVVPLIRNPSAPAFDTQTVNYGWGLWFGGNTWRAWKAWRYAAEAAEDITRVVPRMGPLLDRTLLPVTLLSTAEAFAHRRFLEAASWIPGIIGSLESVMAGPKWASSSLWVLTAAMLVGDAWHNRIEASNHYEPLLDAYTRAARPDVTKPESLANSDENARPFLDMLPALGRRLGFNESQLPQLTDWLYSLPVEQRDRFIDYALQVKPDDQGHYEVGTRKSPDEVGVRDYVTDVIEDPRIQRDQIDTLEDVVMFAEQYGYDLPEPR